MAEEVKLFSLSSYFTLLLTNNLLLSVSFSVMCLCQKYISNCKCGFAWFGSQKVVHAHLVHGE